MTTPTTTIMDDIIDRAVIGARFEDDWQLVGEVAELFLEDCPLRLDAVRAALAAGDSEALQHAAHSIKGSVSNFDAADATQAALRVEMIGRDGDLSHAPAACAALEREISRLTPALVRLVRESDSGGDHAHPHS